MFLLQLCGHFIQALRQSIQFADMGLQRNTCSKISPAYCLHGITELANRIGNAAAAEIYQIKKKSQEQRSYSHSNPEHTRLGFLDTMFAHFHDNRTYLLCGGRLLAG